MATLKVWYDREGDYLEGLFEDALAVLEEIGDDVFERRTPDRRVIGHAASNLANMTETNFNYL